MQEVSFTAKDKLVVPADLQASISKEVENDPHKVETRMKQVQFGKNTAGYDNYLAAVPKNKRQLRPEHPSTPDIYEKISKRQFDGRIKAWRRALHLWDNVDQRPDSKPRQKRKAESLENSETKDGTRSDEKPQAHESTSKRQRTETDSSKAIQSSFAEETVAETKDEIRPSWTIGEEDDDGYVSEDVL